MTRVFQEKRIEAFWKGNGDDLGIGQNHYNIILSICWYCCQIQSIYISLCMKLLLSTRSLDALFEFVLFLRHYDFPFFYDKYHCLDYENFVCVTNNWWGPFLKFVIFYIFISYHKGKWLFICSSFLKNWIYVIYKTLWFICSTRCVWSYVPFQQCVTRYYMYCKYN